MINYSLFVFPHTGIPLTFTWLYNWLPITWGLIDVIKPNLPVVKLTSEIPSFWEPPSHRAAAAFRCVKSLSPVGGGGLLLPDIEPHLCVSFTRTLQKISELTALELKRRENILMAPGFTYLPILCHGNENPTLYSKHMCVCIMVTYTLCVVYTHSI